jgi:hypothetical protein
MSALAAVFLLELERGIVVETDSPDAHCPDLHQTREAVNARLGTIEGTGFRARYTIVHATGDVPRDFVLLELLSPEGEVRLRRELPIGDSCAAVAGAIALVLDQHFRALITDESAAADVHTPSTKASDPVRADALVAPANPHAASAEQSPASWLAMLEVAVLSSSPSVAAGLRVDALFARAWHAGLELAVPLGDQVEVLPGGGEARARSVELNAHLGWGPELGAVRPYLGPTLFMVLERAYTTSPLESSTRYRLLGGAGGELGLNVRLGERWRTVAFATAGGIFAQSATFVVGGEEVLAGIGWVGKAGLGLAYAF